MKDKWLNDIHDRMADFDIEEPTGLWDDIASELVKEGFPSPKPASSPVSFWVKRLSGVAAMLTVVVGGALWIVLRNNPNEQQFNTLADMNQQKTSFKQRNDNYISKPSNQLNNPSVINTSIIQNQEKCTSQMAVSIPMDKPVQNRVEDSEYKIIQSKILPDSIGLQNSKDSTSNNVSTKSENKNFLQQNNSQNRYIAYVSKHKSVDGRISVGAYTSGGLNSMSVQTSNGTPASTMGSGGTEWEDKPVLGILLFNKGKEIETEVKHRLPIRTGVSFDYHINDRFSIGSGLTYTNLTSDLKFGSDSHYISGTQTLHYIGIPFHLRYRVMNWKRLDVYVSCTVLAEKCVKGKKDSDYVLDNQKHGSDTESIMVKPLQWSINPSAGLQLNITSLVGLYVEPGVSYYFDNHSPVETIYKDKPFNFNLNIGLRFNFGK